MLSSLFSYTSFNVAHIRYQLNHFLRLTEASNKSQSHVDHMWDHCPEEETLEKQIHSKEGMYIPVCKADTKAQQRPH